MRTYYVYIRSDRHRGTLYTGMTNNLEHRVSQHKAGETKGFTRKYHVHQLVYHESTTDVLVAIGREKEIKGWTRAKKVALIESVNPHWDDLSEA
jgi:putative endonuclease